MDGLAQRLEFGPKLETDLSASYSRLLGLPGRHFEPLPAPDPFHTLVVHQPARLAKSYDLYQRLRQHARLERVSRDVNGLLTNTRSVWGGERAHRGPPHTFNRPTAGSNVGRLSSPTCPS